MINSILLRLISDEVYSSNIGIIDGNIIMNGTEAKKNYVLSIICLQTTFLFVVTEGCSLLRYTVWYNIT